VPNGNPALISWRRLVERATGDCLKTAVVVIVENRQSSSFSAADDQVVHHPRQHPPRPLQVQLAELAGQTRLALEVVEFGFLMDMLD